MLLNIRNPAVLSHTCRVLNTLLSCNQKFRHRNIASIATARISLPAYILELHYWSRLLPPTMFKSFQEHVFGSLHSRQFSSTIAVDENALQITSNNSSAIESGQKLIKYFHSINEHQQPIEPVVTNYEEAVKALNALQASAKSPPLQPDGTARNVLDCTKTYLIRSGLTIDDLAALSYIHVSGTKGKGSTCAMTESILRAHGVKTGFFSSPHLICLTERIRINGLPISKEKFTQTFWPLYKKFIVEQKYKNDMPGYFQFLTILSFHIFLQERVDVVILEVGIGGELDSTNIVPNTRTVGITSLGLEHTQLLGDTLEEIAWQKAGIIKDGCNVYTNVTQSECLKIIGKRAMERNANVYQVPPLDIYEYDKWEKSQHLRNLNPVITLNGSLAIQLANDWLRQERNICLLNSHNKIDRPNLTEKAIVSLLNFNWPGRCQIVQFYNFNMHLDGAHTRESIHLCSNWFRKVTANSSNTKILFFNTTGERNSQELLAILKQCNEFDLICFIPNVSNSTITWNSNLNSTHDNQSFVYNYAEQMQRVQQNAKYWQELCQLTHIPNKSQIFPCVHTAFGYLLKNFVDKQQQFDILVTGSIHLLGATILALNEFDKNDINSKICI